MNNYSFMLYISAKFKFVSIQFLRNLPQNIILRGSQDLTNIKFEKNHNFYHYSGESTTLQEGLVKNMVRNHVLQVCIEQSLRIPLHSYPLHGPFYCPGSEMVFLGFTWSERAMQGLTGYERLCDMEGSTNGS